MADGNGREPMIQNAYEIGQKLTPKVVDRLIREQNMRLANALDEQLLNFRREIQVMVKMMIDAALLQVPTERSLSLVPEPTDPEDG